jgi:hypothetical protein
MLPPNNRFQSDVLCHRDFSRLLRSNAIQLYRVTTILPHAAEASSLGRFNLLSHLTHRV